MEKLSLIGIGNIYLDNNVFGVNTGGKESLESGQDYLAKNSETVVGGSAVSFLMQAKKLGLSVAFCGRMGKDENGRIATSLLKEKGINADLIVTTNDDSTSMAINMNLDHNGEFVGVHWGNASRNLSVDDIDLSSPLFLNASAVYFGGTAKQERIIMSFPSLLPKIKELGPKIILDPNRFLLEAQDDQRTVILNVLQYVDLYLPNENELKQVAQTDDLDKALEIAINKGVKIIAVKLGPNGCRIKTDKEDLTIPGFQVTPVTTVGAGDTFNAGFTVKYLEGGSLEECARFATAVAAIKVSQNMMPTREEVEQFIKTNSSAH